MTYTPPNGDNVDFVLEEYTPPIGSSVDFQLGSDEQVVIKTGHYPPFRRSQ